MNDIDSMKILSKAVETFGSSNQMIKAVEEMSELTFELAKTLTNLEMDRAPLGIIEEIADVEIMLDQLKLIYGKDRIELQRSIKLNRLRRKLEEMGAFHGDVGGGLQDTFTNSLRDGNETPNQDAGVPSPDPVVWTPEARVALRAGEETSL